MKETLSVPGKMVGRFEFFLDDDGDLKVIATVVRREDLPADTVHALRSYLPKLTADGLARAWGERAPHGLDSAFMASKPVESKLVLPIDDMGTIEAIRRAGRAH